MKYFLDCEFIDDGKTIEMISIGVVAETGAFFYAENADCDLSRANDWVKANVIPYLEGNPRRIPKAQIAEWLEDFIGNDPFAEFWGYYSDYDHVCIAQLYGPMVNLPKHFPRFTMDVKQLCVSLGNPLLPPQNGQAHNALDDARHIKECWEYLTEAKSAAYDQGRM